MTRNFHITSGLGQQGYRLVLGDWRGSKKRRKKKDDIYKSLREVGVWLIVLLELKILNSLGVLEI